MVEGHDDEIDCEMNLTKQASEVASRAMQTSEYEGMGQEGHRRVDG